MNTNFDIPVQDSLEVMKGYIATIQETYYTDEMTCARRIHFGTVLRNITDDVYLALDETEQEALKRFHGCSHILIPFMMEQRRKDTIRGKYTFINFKTLNTLSKYYASQQEEGVPA